MVRGKEKEEKKYNVGFKQKELEDIKELSQDEYSALKCYCDK